MKKLILILLTIFAFFSCSKNKPIQSSNEQKIEKNKLIACSYNIHIGKGMDNKINLKRIADIVLNNKCDIVGLQEIDRFTTRCGKIDQFAELKNLTGMNGVFGKSIDFSGGEYGIGILTKNEILDYKHTLLPQGREGERRSFISAKIKLKNGFVFWAINTHLGLDDDDRKVQAGEIIKYAASLSEPVILLGDFNETPNLENGIYKSLSENFIDCWKIKNKSESFYLWDITSPIIENKDNYIYNIKENGNTYSSVKPEKRIDYIWIKKNINFEVPKFMIVGTPASDHLPIFAEILFK